METKDIMKVGAKEGTDLNYDVAYCGLCKWKEGHKAPEKLSYQQIAGYLSSFLDLNPGSTVDMETTEED